MAAPPVADPFLLAHQAGPRFFDLSGKLSPISIRDQMNRARLIVDRAIDHWILQPSAPLLVVGAGACGATAAIRAAQRGVPSLLIDRRQGPFLRQAGCTTRWIDPTQYDWPGYHFGTGVFPHAGVTMPLTWRAERSRHVARQWVASFRSALASLPLLAARWNTTLDWPPAFHEDRIHLILRGPAGPERIRVGLVLVASGGGAENTRAFPRGTLPPRSGFRGHSFWEDDPFELPRTGLTSVGDRVLISGGGDGALQDFLRLTTRKRSAREILAALSIPNMGPIMAAIAYAEERALRATHWNLGPRYDHEILAELEQAHRNEVHLLLQDINLRSNLDGVLSDRPEETLLIHPCDHFGPSYALNRFLSLLILEFMSGRSDCPVRREIQESVISVDPTHTSHSCRSPGQCLGHDHDVTLLNHPFCYEDPRTTRTQEHANVVVIRHGIFSEQIPWLSLTPMANYRQILPGSLLL